MSDGFLSATTIGRLLIRLLYVNQEYVSTVPGGIDADPHVQSYARVYDDTWRDWIENCLDNPDDPAAVVTPELVNDFCLALDMHLTNCMTAEEMTASYACGAIIEELHGSPYQQVLAFMDLPATSERVEAMFAELPTIVDAGPFDPHDEWVSRR